MRAIGKNWVYMLLFTGLGLLWFLLITLSSAYADWRAFPLLTLSGFGLLFAAGFNILGFTTLGLARRLERTYPQYAHRRQRMLLSYIGIGLLLLLLNYTVFAGIKLAVGAKHPLAFPHGGWKILLLIWLVELVVLGLTVANQSMQNMLELQRQAAALRAENDKARYTALQNQIDPHFLFNSLNTLVAELEYDTRNAIVFVRNLSDVYRYVLRMRERETATLSEELSFIDAYLFLHRVRMGDCITVEQRYDSHPDEIYLPPLTLQLLVENVLKHNTASEHAPLHIYIVEEPDGYLCVSNNIRRRRLQERQPGMGLSNLDSRCQLAMGRGIEVREEEGTFCVRVPFMK